MSVEVELARVKATGRLAKLQLPTIVAAGTPTAAAMRGSPRVYAGGEWQDCPIYERVQLGAEALIAGLAIIEQLDAIHLSAAGTNRPGGRLWQSYCAREWLSDGQAKTSH